MHTKGVKQFSTGLKNAGKKHKLQANTGSPVLWPFFNNFPFSNPAISRLIDAKMDRIVFFVKESNMRSWPKLYREMRSGMTNFSRGRGGGSQA